MRLIIDTENQTLTLNNGDLSHSLDLYARETFEILSEYWLKLGWNQKYSYTFTWLGCPIIQLPEDMIRMQELLFQLQPDVIVETGIAHGGSLIFYASLCQTLGKGRIIGIDCEIRPHNRKRLEDHPLKPYITLIEGDSVAREIIEQVKKQITTNERVLVILDSCHTYEHVSKELQAYSEIVTNGSYIIIADGIMANLHDVPRGAAHWKTENPAQAAVDFLKKRNDFILEKPPWLFNESKLKENITYFPHGWLKKIDFHPVE